jgi:hypothetical protein
MNPCCVDKPGIVSFFAQEKKRKICCCTKPKCKGDADICKCDMIGNKTYINGSALSIELNTDGQNNVIASWSSTRTVINEETLDYMIDIYDIWRFNNHDDALFTLTQAVIDKKTNNIIFLPGVIINGTGKYLGASGSIQILVSDNGVLKVNLNM